MTPAQRIGAYVRHVRLAQGRSQRDVAKAAGMTTVKLEGQDRTVKELKGMAHPSLSESNIRSRLAIGWSAQRAITEALRW